MAKYPQPGQVNTRMISPEGLDESQACFLAWAMIRCIAHRLSSLYPLFLAVSPDHYGEKLAHELELSKVNIIDQGSGNLGERIEKVWKAVGGHAPLAFFGIDSPDIPSSALAQIPAILEKNDLALGPTPDGGYWTIAGRKLIPAVLSRIDWGSSSVYHQTRENAHQNGLSVGELPPWHDVDFPEDLAALHQRLQQTLERADLNQIDLECFTRLQQDLQTIVPNLAKKLRIADDSQ